MRSRSRTMAPARSSLGTRLDAMKIAAAVARDCASVAKWAALSRAVIFLLQIASNNLVPDHEGSMQDVDMRQYRHPPHDTVTEVLLGGFDNWDSEYFIFIPTHGYRAEEQALAFFPLYPLLIRTVAMTILFPLSFFTSARSVALLSGVLVNFCAFPIVVAVLYLLTLTLSGNRRLSLLVAALYCLNPASVFFSATYTECLFALCSFSGMLACARAHTWLATCFFALATATRSNGIVLCGYIGYHHLSTIFTTLLNPKVVLKDRIFVMAKSVCTAVVQGLTVVLPFAAFQYYGYFLYCTGEGAQPPFCSWRVPLSYTYVQDHYWDVGFLRYYQFKQIPNFLLASPMIALSCYAVWKYSVASKESFEGSTELRPYVVHLGFLLCFGTFNMHIQVCTRLICSSSPVVFWFSAAAMLNTLRLLKKSAIVEPKIYSTWEIFRTIAGALFPNLRAVNLLQPVTGELSELVTKFVVLYFLTYILLGVLLHCNFLPWT